MNCHKLPGREGFYRSLNNDEPLNKGDVCLSDWMFRTWHWDESKLTSQTDRLFMTIVDDNAERIKDKDFLLYYRQIDETEQHHILLDVLKDRRLELDL